MKILISSRAEKQLLRQSKSDQIAIARKIRSLVKNSDVAGEVALKGMDNVFRVRVGDYRLVYRKRKDQIFIVLIGHRRDVYRVAKRLLG